MALLDEDFVKLDAVLLALPEGENPLAAVRAAFPDLRVTRCSADDMREETPFRSSGHFNVFLLGNADHCWHMTKDPACAGGLVIAARS